MPAIAQIPPFSINEFASYLGLSRFDDTQFLLRKCLEQATADVTNWSGFVFSRTNVTMTWLPSIGRFVQIDLFPVWEVSLPTDVPANVIPNNDPTKPKNHCEFVLDDPPDNVFEYVVDVGNDDLEGYELFKTAVLQIAELRYRTVTTQKQQPSELLNAVQSVLAGIPKRGW